jgi:hypothetical protein
LNFRIRTPSAVRYIPPIIPDIRFAFFWSGCRFNRSSFVVRLPRWLFVTTPAATRGNRGKLMVTDLVTYLSFDGRREGAFQPHDYVKATERLDHDGLPQA